MANDQPPYDRRFVPSGLKPGKDRVPNGKASHSSRREDSEPRTSETKTATTALAERSKGQSVSSQSDKDHDVATSMNNGAGTRVPPPNLHHQILPVSPTSTGLENLTVRDRRRDAIYGAHNLQIASSDSSMSSQSAGLRSTPGYDSSSMLGWRPGRPHGGYPNQTTQPENLGPSSRIRANLFAPGAAPLRGHVREHSQQNVTARPALTTGRPQTSNPPPGTSASLRASNGLSAERRSFHNIRRSRFFGQSNSRRDSSVVRSNEDLNNMTRQSDPGCGVSRSFETESRGQSFTFGNTAMTGVLPTASVFQQQPSLSSNIDQSEDAGRLFLPFAEVEPPVTPWQHPEQKLSSNIPPNFPFPRPRLPKVRKTADNSYTSPTRMADAIKSSLESLKRKRTVSDPPPAYVYVRANDPNFDIFSNGFLLYPELCFLLAAQMPLRDLVSLYAISKDFHTIIDSRFTTVCLTQAVRKAPESAKTFHFRSYAQFSRTDPIARIPHPDPTKAASSIPRTIPSFRWVAFVLHREKVVHELMTIFAERACPLPPRCSSALRKMWFIMDVPENARRIGLIHNPRFITDADLYFMMCVIVKLDMIANDPVAAEKRDGLRRLLLSQEGGLDVMNKVLKREMWRKQSDYLAAHVRCNSSLGPFNDNDLDAIEVDGLFGVPRHEVGIGKFEYWGKKGIKDAAGTRRPYLMRPDQLVQREAIRRGIDFSQHYLRCVLYGYIDPETLVSYPPRDLSRRIPEWKDEDYDILDSVGGLRALSLEDGGDPLLDLGDTNRGSPYIIKKQPVSEEEKAMIEAEDAFTKRMYELSKMERDAEKARKARIQAEALKIAADVKRKDISRMA